MGLTSPNLNNGTTPRLGPSSLYCTLYDIMITYSLSMCDGWWDRWVTATDAL